MLKLTKLAADFQSNSPIGTSYNHGLSRHSTNSQFIAGSLFGKYFNLNPSTSSSSLVFGRACLVKLLGNNHSVFIDSNFYNISHNKSGNPTLHFRVDGIHKFQGIGIINSGFNSSIFCTITLNSSLYLIPIQFNRILIPCRIHKGHFLQKMNS